MTNRMLSHGESRVEGVAKTTGDAEYVSDVAIEGMVHVAYLRSPYAHAQLLNVDVSAALDSPGVVDVITGNDVRPHRLGRNLQDWPLLAWDRVRFVGDRVAAVVATTPAQAKRAAWLIDAEYDELGIVDDVDVAIARDDVLLHPEFDEYRTLLPRNAAIDGRSNVYARLNREHGDVDAGFAHALHVFEHEFELPRTAQGYLEPRATLVWEDAGTIHVLTTNKAPFKLREQLSLSLGISQEELVIHNRYIGGDFGGKGLSIEEYLLVLLCKRTGRPVKFVASYDEELTAGNSRHFARIRLRTGVDGEGRIVAHEAYSRFTAGAYCAANPGPTLLPGQAAYSLAGYRVPAARISVIGAYTNSIPAGSARSPGQPQNGFAAESHIDEIARALQIDPLEIRRRNALGGGDIDVGGIVRERCLLPQVIDTLRDEVGPAPSGPGRGRGFAIGARPSASGSAEVVLEVSSTSAVRITTGAPEQGGGVLTMIQRVAAEEIGVEAHRVEVVNSATDESPYDVGVGGSRVTPIVGGATRAAARQLVVHLEGIAPGAGRDVQLAQCAEQGGLRLSGTYTHPTGEIGTNAYCVDVAVDPETGVIQILDCVLVVDVGTLINPIAARGQLVGGFVSGLGQALMEELVVEGGAVTTSHLGDYKMPSCDDIPPLRLVILPDDQGEGPFGAKSVGELTNSAIAPAIANAVADATGFRAARLPIRAEDVVFGTDAETPMVK